MASQKVPGASRMSAWSKGHPTGGCQMSFQKCLKTSNKILSSSNSSTSGSWIFNMSFQQEIPQTTPPPKKKKKNGRNLDSYLNIGSASPPRPPTNNDVSLPLGRMRSFRGKNRYKAVENHHNNTINPPCNQTPFNPL